MGTATRCGSCYPEGNPGNQYTGRLREGMIAGAGLDVYEDGPEVALTKCSGQ
ncbi:MAG: hypothetical protein GX977_10750 [Firmicutes bacterium]|nr:hypothetical protein [Bacillota bacterium]